MMTGESVPAVCAVRPALNASQLVEVVWSTVIDEC